MGPSIEMDRIDIGGKIVKIENIVEKNAIMISKNRKRMSTIIIPMLGVIILSLGLTIGVLSGYLLRLPHQQTNESGQTELSKPGRYAVYLELNQFINIL